MRTSSIRKSGKRSQGKVSKVENVGMKAIFFSVLVMPLFMLMKRATINRKIRGFFYHKMSVNCVNIRLKMPLQHLRTNEGVDFSRHT
jgi:hypothetical protein